MAIYRGTGSTETGTATDFTVNPSAAITGGTIDGATVGATTPAAGTFTALTSTGIDDNADSVTVTLDSNENVSIGRTSFDAHDSSSTALQIGGNNNINTSTASAVAGWMDFLQNAYWDGTNYRYIIEDEASGFELQHGLIYLSTAASAAADSVITWTNAIIINNAGDTTFAGTALFAAGEGAVFNGDSLAAANTLDDYEEGTFTIAIEFGGGSVSQTTSSNTGYYTKVGRMVTVSGRIILTAKGSSTGAGAIVGLPFTSGSAITAGSIYTNTVTFANILGCFIANSAVAIDFRETTEGGASSTLTHDNFSDTSFVAFEMTYSV